MPLYPEDPATIAYSHEPRSLRVTAEPIPAGQSIGVGVPMIPARLNGINGIDVSSSGRQYTIGLDIASLPVAPGIPPQQWLACWVEGMPVDSITRVAVNAIPEDAPANGIVYGRKDHAWFDIGSLSIPWDNITGKPATFPPSSHTHPMEDIIGLTTEIARIDDTNEAQDTDIAALQFAASTAIGDAPADDEMYGRKNNLWTVIEGGGTGTVEIADIAPEAAIEGSFWWESDTGFLFLRYPNDGAPTWVQVNGFPDAPVDGTPYNRVNGSWAPASAGGAWGDISGKPTTIAGYGITDAYTKAQVDTSLSAKAPINDAALTGSPTAPTASTGNNSTLIATTAFVKAQAYLSTTAADTNYVNVGGDTMTAPLALPLGTAAAPALKVGPSFQTGLYVTAGAGDALAFTYKGVSVATLSSTGFTNVSVWRGGDGSVASPAYSFGSDTNSGLYRSNSTGDIGMSVANAAVMTWAHDGSKLTTALGPIALPGDPASALHAATKQMVDAKQAADPTLTALAGLDSSLGVVEMIAIDTFSKRAVGTGTNNYLPTWGDVQSAILDSTGTIGLLGFFDYTFNSTNYVAPPAAGNFRMNNANQTLVTHIFVHEQTAPGNDAALMLAQIVVGDRLLMQKKTDATAWRRYSVTAISDAGSYWDFTVTYVDGGSALDSARTAIVVQKAAGGGGGALTDGDKGDIVVSASGTTWLFDSAVVTAAAKTVLSQGSTANMLTTLGGTAVGHTHTQAEISGLGTTLAGKQTSDSTLTALAGLDTVAGLVEQTGSDAFTKRLIGVANTTDIPTRANGDARWQGLDATLTALAGLNTTAGLVEQTGTDTFAKATVTTFGKSLIDDADAGTAQTTLGISTFVKTILDDTDAATVRGTIGVGSMATRAITVSTSAPSGGADGDVWFKV